MAATDLVPCFYTGQNYRAEQPAEFRFRHEVRECARQKLGQFIENGRLFLFSKRVVKKVIEICDGPVTAKNLLRFTKTRTDGGKLHYEIPMAGDRSIFARHQRRLIHVSSRSLFSRQAIA